MATKTEKEVKVKSYRTRSGKRVNPFRRRQKVSIRSNTPEAKDKNQDEDNKKKKALIIGASVGIGAASLLVLTNKKVKSDLKKSQVDFDSIRQPPGGVVDKATLAKYDQFPPGSLIRKNFKSDRMGTRQHYAVYTGKDPITGDHMLIDTGVDWKSRDQVPYVRKRGLTWDAGPNDSEYELVPPSEMIDAGKVFKPEEILERADSMLYQRFRYEGFTSNCEAFARGIVEGKAYSTQAEAVSPLTNQVSKIATDNLLKFRSPADYFPGSDEERKSRILSALSRNKLTGFSEYLNEKHKWSAGEMADFLNNRKLLDTVIDPTNIPSKSQLKLIAKVHEMERIRDARRKSWEYLKNPYNNDRKQLLLAPSDRPEVKFGRQEPDQSLTFMSDLCFSSQDVVNANLSQRYVQFLNFFGLEDPEVFSNKVEEAVSNLEGEEFKSIVKKQYLSSYLFLTLYSLKSLLNKSEISMKKESNILVEFARRKPKSAEEKQSISQGLKVYWQKRGKRDAAIAGTGAIALGILSRQQLKKTIADVVKTNVKSTITGEVAEQAGRDFAKGAKEEAAKTFEKAKDKVLGSKTGKFVSEVASTPSRTKQAFNTGLNVKPANENDPSVNRGKALGRVYNRARQDTKKVKSWFGFSQTSQPFFFEPVDSERHPRLIEFAKRKKKPSAKKPLSAAHKAKISAGLQEYYDSIPKKEETIVDKGEKVTKSIGRVARSAKTFAEAANLAANVYERFKKPEVRQGIGAGILGAAAVVSGVAGSFRDVGSATRSLAGAADIVHDLATGSKKKRQKYREDVLQAKREANKTNRQVHSVRAKLERRKMEQKKVDQDLKRVTSTAYQTLVDTTARTKPSEVAAALQRAATGAKKEGISKQGTPDYWFL